MIIVAAFSIFELITMNEKSLLQLSSVKTQTQVMRMLEKKQKKRSPH